MSIEDAVDDPEEEALLKAMEIEADEYVARQKWAPQVAGKCLCYGVGKVVAIFLFDFVEPIAGGDDRKVWIVVGDLPAAYMVMNDEDSPALAMETYCGLTEDWCEAVETGSSLEDVFPVSAPATRENASLLRSRIGFIRTEILKDVPTSLPN